MLSGPYARCASMLYASINIVIYLHIFAWIFSCNMDAVVGSVRVQTLLKSIWMVNMVVVLSLVILFFFSSALPVHASLTSLCLTPDTFCPFSFLELIWHLMFLCRRNPQLKVTNQIFIYNSETPGFFWHVFRLCDTSVTEWMCVLSCICVGLSGELGNGGLGVGGSLGDQWCFKRHKSTWAWQWWTWVVDVRFCGIHDNIRCHGALIPPVVFGPCAQLSRQRVVSW